jgi:hypothetical protein
MHNILRTAALSSLFIAASWAYGDVPAMSVIVSDAGGKTAYKGTTNATGGFTTAHLSSGHYVVQFNAKSSAVKGNHYALVVAAGNKKVSAGSVPGEKFTGGGVAMRLDVGAGLNITGQVATETTVSAENGKILVWIPPMLGSNMPGHWAEKGSAEEITSRTRGIIPRANISRIHDDARSF